MIKTILIGVGALAGISVLAYATRKWWLPRLNNLCNGQQGTDITDPKPPTKVKKEAIEKLSYEYIVKSFEKACADESIKIPADESEAQLVVLPNKVAQEYYVYAKEQGQAQPFLLDEELTDEEKEKMVAVMVRLSGNTNDILWGRVFIPSMLTDDFHDFIPTDKLYVKPIHIGESDQ